jgi:hypothetical protein
MIDRGLFPPPAKILSATIGITFVGPKGHCDPMMLAMFRVRCWKVKEALIWLNRKEGIFGRVQTYVRTVEAQGRGTLHLHMLLWLKDAPCAADMKAALKVMHSKTR